MNIKSLEFIIVHFSTTCFVWLKCIKKTFYFHILRCIWVYIHSISFDLFCPLIDLFHLAMSQVFWILKMHSKSCFLFQEVVQDNHGTQQILHKKGQRLLQYFPLYANYIISVYFENYKKTVWFAGPEWKLNVTWMR